MLLLLPVLALLVVTQSAAPAQTCSISGRVVEDETHAPVIGARVSVMREDADQSAPGSPPGTTTDEDGRYVIEKLPPGTYRIAAHKAGFVPPMDPSLERSVRLGSGEALKDVDLSIRRGGTIAGRVLDPNGQIVAGTRVTAFLKHLSVKRTEASDPRMHGARDASEGVEIPAPFGGGETNDLGQFRIYGLAPGEYFLAAAPQESDGHGEASTARTVVAFTFYPQTLDASAAVAVPVDAGQTVDGLTIQLLTVRAFRISGVVIDSVGAPVANVMVMGIRETAGRPSIASFLGDSRLMVQTDANGRFVIAGVPGGTYKVSATPDQLFAASFGSFVIGPDGTPRRDPDEHKPVDSPGTLTVTVTDEDVSGLRLVAPRSPR